MIIKLPLSSDPAQSFITQLGSTKYQFDVRWNDRAAVWCADIVDAATQQAILQGLPLVLGCELLQPYNLAMGRLLVVDETGTAKDASYDDLGTRVNVYWISADEVAE
jgi:hypothetical protein